MPIEFTVVFSLSAEFYGLVWRSHYVSALKFQAIALCICFKISGDRIMYLFENSRRSQLIIDLLIIRVIKKLYYFFINGSNHW
ncbi:MAG: hypothetical protein QNJ18_19635 [Xenococcaceae cyanobacterium MO_167.B52]|nr:hypothetical protein [Xenococcaceae cyanobacterium MO_167.B52]